MEAAGSYRIILPRLAELLVPPADPKHPSCSFSPDPIITSTPSPGLQVSSLSLTSTPCCRQSPKLCPLGGLEVPPSPSGLLLRDSWPYQKCVPCPAPVQTESDPNITCNFSQRGFPTASDDGLRTPGFAPALQLLAPSQDSNVCQDNISQVWLINSSSIFSLPDLDRNKSTEALCSLPSSSLGPPLSVFHFDRLLNLLPDLS